MEVLAVQLLQPSPTSGPTFISSLWQGITTETAPRSDSCSKSETAGAFAIRGGFCAWTRIEPASVRTPGGVLEQDRQVAQQPGEPPA